MGQTTKGLKLKAYRLTKVSNADKTLMLRATSKALTNIKAFKSSQNAIHLDKAMEYLNMIVRCANGYHSKVHTYSMSRNPLF
ncbi:MAG TPA: hypothetical protein ENN24_06290 [Bacteroidetes bacterium]|nr:hypothetical protein [Bacteroidota bacterium]